MQIPIFDAHCDTLYELDRKGGHLYSNGCQVDLEKCENLLPHARFYAIFGDAKHMECSPTEHFDRLYELFSRELARYSDSVSLCLSGKQAERLAAEGKTAAFLSVEGAELLDCSVEKLKEAYHKGVRAVNLTWNHQNALSGSCVEASERGLSQTGRDFVKTMLELGMLPDVSHLSRPGFWDVAEICKEAGKPFFASHSNAKAICGHARNLDDDQIRALIDCGGAAGINFYTAFLTDKETCELSDIERHIEHFLSLGGQRCLAVGSDFDGCESLPDGIGGAEDMQTLYSYLLQRNYPQTLLDDIFYNNLMRVVNRACNM